MLQVAARTLADGGLVAYPTDTSYALACHIGDKRALETEWRDESLHVAQQVKARAEAAGIVASQFATAWGLNNALVTGVVAGPRTMAQWQDSVGALASPFTAAEEAFRDALVAAGHPSTPGYNDPQYGVEGRISRA